MKHLGLATCVALAVVGLGATGQGEANLSLGRGFGIGVRWLPLALAPVSEASDLTLAFGPTVALQYWFTEQLGAEVGGWMSSQENSQGFQSTATLLMGGLLLRLSDNVLADGYLAGRAMGMHRRHKAIPIPLAGSEANNVVPPWPSYESRSVGLAVELAGGVEWSWSPQVSTSFELGFAYVQVVTTQTSPPPPDEPPDGEPRPLPGSQTFAATGLGMVLRVGISFHFPRK